ncbi:HNH endonuclease [Mesoplasma florum]|uniref:HNH endonuclease n=1 Tax=Mesoplasma florum TaxID=2151 RepID=UPI0018F87DC2|nr:HNH endonuclease signature motif containing protein [Mesoplasma florum]
MIINKFNKDIFDSNGDKIGNIDIYTLKKIIISYKLFFDYKKEDKNNIYIKNKNSKVNLSLILDCYYYSKFSKKAISKILQDSKIQTINEIEYSIPENFKNNKFTFSELYYVLNAYLKINREYWNINSNFDFLFAIDDYLNSDSSGQRTIDSFVFKVGNLYFFDSLGMIKYKKNAGAWAGGEITWGNKKINNFKTFMELDDLEQEQLSKKRISNILLNDKVLLNLFYGLEPFEQFDEYIKREDYIETKNIQSILYKKYEELKNNNLFINEEDKKRLIEILTRDSNQQKKWKKNLIKKNGEKCSINNCNFKIKELLIASHIKPYSKCVKKETYDVNNGLILCPEHDALFDKKYISFSDSGELIINMKKLKVEDFIKNESKLNNNIINNELISYLRYHRKEECKI